MKFWNFWSMHLQLGIFSPTRIHRPLHVFALVAIHEVKFPAIPSPLQKPWSSIIAGWHSTHIGLDILSFSAQVPSQYGCLDKSLKFTQWLLNLGITKKWLEDYFQLMSHEIQIIRYKSFILVLWQCFTVTATGECIMKGVNHISSTSITAIATFYGFSEFP